MSAWRCWSGHGPSSAPGCGIEFDKMSKVFDFSVNLTNLKNLSNSIQNFTGIGAFNTIKSQWSGGTVLVQVQVFSLSRSSATDFRRLFSNTIDHNRTICNTGRSPAHGRWIRRAIGNTGLSESVSVSLGRNRLGPPKQCNLVWILSPLSY